MAEVSPTGVKAKLEVRPLRWVLSFGALAACILSANRVDLPAEGSVWLRPLVPGAVLAVVAAATPLPPPPTAKRAVRQATMGSGANSINCLFFRNSCVCLGLLMAGRKRWVASGAGC